MKILMEKQYNLKETLEIVFSKTLGKAYKTSLADELATFLENQYSSQDIDSDMIKFATFESGTFAYNDYVEEMLNDFYNRFYNYFAIGINENSELAEAVENFLFKFLNVLNVTYPKYAPIIKALTNNENKLMDALSRDYEDSGGSDGTVTQRFNDTPQDGGAYEDDNHTTNINESVSNATSSLTHTETYDNKYVLEKINYIRDNLSNIYTEWENKVATILWR